MGRCRTYPRKRLDLLYVVRKDGWLLALVIPVELGYVVHLDIVPDAIAKTTSDMSAKNILYFINTPAHLHSVASWPISIVFSAL